MSELEKNLRRKTDLEYLKNLIPLIENGEVEIESIKRYDPIYPSGASFVSMSNEVRVSILVKFPN